MFPTFWQNFNSRWRQICTGPRVMEYDHYMTFRWYTPFMFDKSKMLVTNVRTNQVIIYRCLGQNRPRAEGSNGPVNKCNLYILQYICLNTFKHKKNRWKLHIDEKFEQLNNIKVFMKWIYPKQKWCGNLIYQYKILNVEEYIKCTKGKFKSLRTWAFTLPLIIYCYYPIEENDLISVNNKSHINSINDILCCVLTRMLYLLLLLNILLQLKK